MAGRNDEVSLECGGLRQQGLEMAIVSWISRVIACICMLGLQYLLLKIHRLRKLLAPEAIPKVSEVWIGVSGFWMGELAVVALFGGVLSAVFTLINVNICTTDRPGGRQLPDGLLSAVRVLVDRVLVSWILHHGSVMLLDIIIPFSKEQQQNPGKELTRILSRAIKLTTFIHNITFGSPTGAPHILLNTLVQDSDSRTTTQTIRLQRMQTDNPNERQRNLAWNLVIDKEALDEMKETLGPPGGFGELGFSVGRDGVRFEAMGIGTSFVLGFEVAVPREGRVPAVRRKTK
ncbi:hypothetical protein ONS95_006373 [Cadophora gregata]|uniref:uncharacterized protein n=1 Tax=Cadophora gregata TaxID=51156 RepID=UPI0026DD11EF|nr:uncharacterized protein ONS95_006373 [Cadophora gregata]KAK0102776.1 hypothetical protein ONS95_006373 [Cadophora gregata]